MELAVHSRAGRSGRIISRSAHKGNGSLLRGTRQDVGLAGEKTEQVLTCSGHDDKKRM